MKKFGFLLLGAAALTMASCSQEDVVAPNGDGNYHITVKLPADLGTRAMSDGLKADNLLLAVYDADNNNAYVYQDLGLTFGDALETNVSLNLATGKTYNLVFFALSPQAMQDGVFDFNAGTGTLSVDYTRMDGDHNNADDYDCFFRCYNTGVISNNMQTETIELYRPVAQVNWGTNDLDKPAIADNFGAQGEYISASLTTEAYSQLNFFTSDVIADSKVDVKLANWAAPYEETFPVAGYDYIAMQFLLAPKAASAVYDLTLNVSNANKPNTTARDNDIVVSSAPVQANYRTNIYGSLLSDEITYVVEKNPNWETPDYDYDYYDGVQYTVVRENNVNLLTKGGNLILGENITYPSNNHLSLANNTVLNLNHYSITSAGGKYGDAIVIGNGANVRILNGTVNASEAAMADPAFAASEGSSAIILQSSAGGKLTLDNVDVNGGPAYAVALSSTNADAQIVINSGTYYSEHEAGCAIFIANGNVQGSITINGGTFGRPGYPAPYLLNLLDKARSKAPNEYIVVKGGTFINFDPSNCVSEGPGTNFVAPGYKVIANEVGDDMYYTVVPSNANVVETKDGLANALANAKNGDTIIVGAGEDFTMPVNFDKNVTIKGLGADVTTLNSPMSYNASKGANLVFEDLTLKTFVNNANHTSMGFQGSANLTFNNVTIDGQFYVFTGNADFNNCTFEYNAFTQRNSDFQLVHQSSGTVNITNCVMSCGSTGAVSVDAGWAVTTPTIAGGNLYIKGLTVTASGVNEDNAVVNINSRGYTSGGTVSINKVTYNASQFPMGLWNQNNGNGETTNLFTVLVNGQQAN